MSYYWISWVQPGDDVRPMRYPPGERVLGWWSTGYAQGGGQTLCAMVRAVSEAHAKDAVLDDWPEAGEWRFCDPRKTPEVTDRFPLKEWMVERLKTPNVGGEARLAAHQPSHTTTATPQGVASTEVLGGHAQTWERHRFKANGDDYRPVAFPPPGPYWCTGAAMDGTYSVIVAYLPPGEPVTNWWPEATDIDSEPADTITYTDRMPRPRWWQGA